MCTHSHTDPFITTSNVITPFRVDLSSIDEYSVKLKIQNCRNVNNQINVYSGKFVDNLDVAVDGFQNTILKTLEIAFQKYVYTSYVLPTVATINDPPSTYTRSPNDIVVSFAGFNDYLIFRNTGDVMFINNGVVGSFDPLASPYVSSTGTYTVTVASFGNFTITITRGSVTKVLNFNTTGTTYTYDSINLSEDTLVDGTKTYRVPFFTDIGVTRIPSVLPVEQTYVKGSKGYFYQQGYPTISPASLINFLTTGITLTSVQSNMIHNIIYAFFSGVKSSLFHVMQLDGALIFSTNRGFSTFMTVHGVSIEIKLS